MLGGVLERGLANVAHGGLKVGGARFHDLTGAG